MYNYKLLKYGEHITKTEGYKANKEKGLYEHCFGGGLPGLIIEKCNYSPSLILTLDLTDPKFFKFNSIGIKKLPLICVLEDDLWEKKQRYQFFPKDKKIVFTEIGKHNIDFDNLEQLPNPLPFHDINFVELKENEIPSKEETYWECCDTFLGGDSFIRALQPLWLQWVEEHTCCMTQMDYLIGIGYENYLTTNGYINDKPFYLGESSLNFFICKKCLSIIVNCQDS